MNIVTDFTKLWPMLFMSIMYLVLITHLVLYEPRDRSDILIRRLEFWKLGGKINEFYVCVGVLFVVVLIMQDLIQMPVAVKYNFKAYVTMIQTLMGYCWLFVLSIHLIKKLRNIND